MVEIYSLFDTATQEYGPLTFHKSLADARRTLCQQIEKNDDLKPMLCMDFELCFLGYFDQNDRDCPIKVPDLDQRSGERYPVLQIWREYCDNKDLFELAMKPKKGSKK